MSEITTLAEYATIQGGYAYKSTDFLKTGKFKVLKIKNIRFGYIDYSETDFISDQLSKKTEEWKTKPKDILISMTGSGPNAPASLVGRVARVGENEPISFINQRIGRVIVNEKVDSDYIYYLLSQKSSQEYFVNNSTGSANQVNINGNTILSLEVPCISFEESKKIAQILNAFDDKIQLNTQINQTLEQIAQALFKSWFVNFDPVRAKVQALSDGLSLEQAELAAMQAISGKTPEELTALSQTQPERYAELAETAKAFPCEMVEVDGVEVPKGWKIGTFTDITESRREKVKNDKATVLSAVSSGELVKSEEYFTKQVFSKSIDKYLKVYQWDFAYNPARINIGSIGLHEADYLGAVSPVYEVFSVSDKYHWFLKRILNLETTKIKIQSLCTGSVRQTLKLKDFQSIDCVIPDEKTLSIFNKKWEEYRTLILENNENTQTLSEIRDLLLPRLLSGDFNG